METTLALDAGNTVLTWGLFVGDRLDRVGSFPNAAERWEAPFDWSEVDRVALASVRHETDERIRREWPDAPSTVRLGRERPIPVKTHVPHPEQVGADRLVNCLAWNRRSRIEPSKSRATPAVIVDFGTAITFDVVGADGAYLGGLILPGSRLVAGALSRETSLLPEVPIEATPELFGRDTVACIRRGVYGLFRGGVEFHLSQLREQLPAETVFVATGGSAPTFAPWFDSIELVLPYLTLEGIRWAEELSR
ncbi:MAG: type III pantothenate kinase [Planctomycetota bacterium]